MRIWGFHFRFAAVGGVGRVGGADGQSGRWRRRERGGIIGVEGWRDGWMLEGWGPCRWCRANWMGWGGGWRVEGAGFGYWGFVAADADADDAAAAATTTTVLRWDAG